MYNDQDYSVLYNNTVPTVIYVRVGIYSQKALA